MALTLLTTALRVWEEGLSSGGGWGGSWSSEVIPSQDYRDGPSEGQRPPSRCSRAGRRFQSCLVFFEVAQHASEHKEQGADLRSPATSPLGLLLLHDLLALLSAALVDGVARVVDLEGVLVVHVGILDFSGLLVKLQNVSHPKSERGGRRRRGEERRGEIKERQRSAH